MEAAPPPSVMSMTWSDARILKFIEMYRNRPLLWDTRLTEHNDKEKRHTALLELAEHFGVTKEEILRKIKNLLSHFSREVRKVELGSTCPDFQYRSKWFCFSSLQFLRERHCSPKGMAEPRDLRFDGPGLQSIKAEEVDESDIISVSDEPECDPLAVRSPSPNSESVDMYLSPDRYTAAHPEERRLCNSSLSEDDTLTLLREISSLRQGRDEYSLFGEQVAVKIRKLASPYARIMVQHIINTTLFEAEMGKYDDPAPMASTLPAFQPRKNFPATSTSHREPKRQRLE